MWCFQRLIRDTDTFQRPHALGPKGLNNLINITDFHLAMSCKISKERERCIYFMWISVA